ncbi:hypothetical protein KNZ01_19650 [Streptococcus dysgalactiae subsp. equisimilis]|nr:hypothetical protein KNZ01_19650 [Streptococcus dysgalactiae subsp. equisimilis]
MLVKLSGVMLNYIVTPASVHDIKGVDELLEGCKQTVVLADLGYLSQELKDKRGLSGLQLRLEQFILAYNLKYFEIN